MFGSGTRPYILDELFTNNLLTHLCAYFIKVTEIGETERKNLSPYSIYFKWNFYVNSCDKMKRLVLQKLPCSKILRPVMLLGENWNQLKRVLVLRFISVFVTLFRFSSLKPKEKKSSYTTNSFKPLFNIVRGYCTSMSTKI